MKKNYEKPKLIDHGNLKEVTKGTVPGGFDENNGLES
ncbi:MAG: lasso RiPP family leader peptide-containing protein [Euryarchaeota archaeon]